MNMEWMGAKKLENYKRLKIPEANNCFGKSIF